MKRVKVNREAELTSRVKKSKIEKRGKEEMKEVEEEIKGMSNTSWFIMVKK